MKKLTYRGIAYNPSAIHKSDSIEKGQREPIFTYRGKSYIYKKVKQLLTK